MSSELRVRDSFRLWLSEELRILSESETQPFHIEENSKTKEEVRLKYR